ncbi:hypothetical protein EON63_15750 [archaeon]|nr:MAG: hypothetical protein EON63_15750 [archaeon]
MDTYTLSHTPYSFLQVFINDEGEATDRFLEALKMDIHAIHTLPIHTTIHTSLPHIHTRTQQSSHTHTHTHSRQDMSSSRSESEHEKNVSYLSPTHSSRLRSEDTTDSHVRRSRSLSPSFRISSLSSNHAHTHTQHTSHPTPHTHTHTHTPLNRKNFSKIAPFDTKNAFLKKKKRREVGVSASSILLPIDVKDTIQPVKDTKVCSRFYERNKRASQKQRISKQHHTHTHTQNGVYGDGDEDGDGGVYGGASGDGEGTSELQAKIRSLTLRCAGQRNTIKTLESQISGNLGRLTQAHEILLLLQNKNKQLAYQLEMYKDGEGKGERVTQVTCMVFDVCP